MVIQLNAFPLSIPESISVCEIPYEQEQLKTLRNKYKNTHVFFRDGNKILIFSSNNEYPVDGKIIDIQLTENPWIFCFLVKQGLISEFIKKGRQPSSYNPIEMVSDKENILKKVIEEDYPFQIRVKFTFDTRIIRGVPCLIIDCSTKKTVSENADYFLRHGFDLKNRYVMSVQDDGRKKRIGRVKGITGDSIEITCSDGRSEIYNSSDIYLEVNSENFYDYITHSHGSKAASITEKIRKEVSLFTRGDNKKKYIDVYFNYFKDRKIKLIDGRYINIGDAPDIRSESKQLDSPIFIFNDNRALNSKEKGLTEYGPYTKRTFDRHDPSICVICNQYDKGRVEQFIRKLLKGIPSNNYFKTGFEGKFNIGTSRVEFFTTTDDHLSSYKTAIENAIKRKADNDGQQWDLALVQVKQSFKKLNVVDNPYYLGKSLLFLHQIPVQDFTLELIANADHNLGYSLNNMALACYAKMSGIPWLLKSSPTMSHELVIGIGSANIVSNTHSGEVQRIMGITTVFSGDGSYIVSNTSKAVSPNEYCNALTIILGETIQKIERQRNWQIQDTIRLVFHASVKEFNKDEIKAVQSVIKLYKNYNIEYAFLKISDNHGLHLFDHSTENELKGKLAPLRGKSFKLSQHEMLIYLIGQKDLKQVTDGHPQGVILSIHKESTFKDIKYLSNQVFNFSAHSWRSYFPNPMPVTISYSDLIAKNLGWLNQLSGWNDSTLFGKIGQTQWFL